MEKFSYRKIEKTLISYGIDTSKWGKQGTKTLKQLEDEIKNGESVLVENNNEIFRQVSVASVDIYYQSEDGRKFHLKELKQVFLDGEERYRNIKQSVSEKIKFNEKPEETMKRGIQEELGVKSLPLLVEDVFLKKEIESVSYPGLNSKYLIYMYHTEFDKNQYKKDGYIEVQPDKTTYFVWEEIS